MSGGTVTQAYLLGIREGRAMLQRFASDGIVDAATIRAHLANLASQKGLSGDMQEARRGERDFFARQLAKLEGKAA
jgi:hypothetical protein